MNRNQLSPNDNSTGKLNQCQIVDILFFITHKKFSKAIHVRMKHLDNPSTSLIVWILFLLLLLFSAGNNVRFIVPVGYSILLSCVASIKTKVLLVFLCHFGTSNHYIVQSVFQ